MDYLVFRLYGPMASWGDIAVGEARHSSIYPSKSAITGLLAAALGIDRADDAEHRHLAKGYWQATKVLRRGEILNDFHTAQAPDSVGKFRYRTRRDELVQGRSRLGTVLSRREYRSDAHVLVALHGLEGMPYPLTDLQQALHKPKFHLYLGRKSCPLAAPVDAQCLSAADFKHALDQYTVKPLLDPKVVWASDQRYLPADTSAHYCWEGSIDAFASEPEFDPRQVQSLVRYDQPLSRVRWQFEPRTEYMWLAQAEAD